MKMLCFSVCLGADVRIDRFMLTDQGVVGVSLSNGCSFTYSTDLCCWFVLCACRMK